MSTDMSLDASDVSSTNSSSSSSSSSSNSPPLQQQNLANGDHLDEQKVLIDRPISIIFQDIKNNTTTTIPSSVHTLRHSKFFSVALEDDTATEISINSEYISIYAFNKIMEYLSYHADDSVLFIPTYPAKSKDMINIVKDSWDATYIDEIWTHPYKLYDVMVGATYLDISALIHLAACKVATVIKGHTCDDIPIILCPQS